MNSVITKRYMLDGWLEVRQIMNDVAGKRWEMSGVYTAKDHAVVVTEHAKSHAEIKKMASMILARIADHG